MRFLFLESFYRGSHALFADGLTTASRHTIDLKTLPGEFWKWRMLGASLYFAETAPALDSYDGLIVSDLFNLADFLAIRGATGSRKPPVLVYFHENQLTYPPPPGDKGAFQTGIINITTALAADRIAFNSVFHREAFLAAIPPFLQKGRDCRPAGVVEAIRPKATVLYPGIVVSRPEPEPKPEKSPPPLPPLIIWNHRWSFDKNYADFFRALETIHKQNISFRLALLGDNYGKIPPEFEQAREQFRDHICHFGFIASRPEYFRWLRRGALVISTARQENFGLAVIEAMLCGCLPLLPERLAYPEILPAAYHRHCLYRSQAELTEKLAEMLVNQRRRDTLAAGLRREMSSFLWPNRIQAYDETLTALGKMQPGPGEEKIF